MKNMNLDQEPEKKKKKTWTIYTKGNNKNLNGLQAFMKVLKIRNREISEAREHV